MSTDQPSSASAAPTLRPEEAEALARGWPCDYCGQPMTADNIEYHPGKSETTTHRTCYQQAAERMDRLGGAWADDGWKPTYPPTAFSSARAFVRTYLPTLIAFGATAFVLFLHMAGVIKELPALTAVALCLMVISLNGLSVYVPFMPTPEIGPSPRRWRERWLARILAVVGFAGTTVMGLGFDKMTRANAFAPEVAFGVCVAPWIALILVLRHRARRGAALAAA